MSRLLIDYCLALRWRDLDAYEHVNNSVFLTFLEEARIRWFDSLSGPWRSADYAPVLAAVNLNFRRQILYPENLRIRLTTERVGRSSIAITHRITAAADDAVLYADGNTVVVWVAPIDGKPIPLPEVVRLAAEPAD